MTKAVGHLKLLLRDDLADELAQATASTALERIVKAHALSGGFQDFYCSRDLDMQRKYLPATSHMKRESRFRASKAGECPQRQAYTAFFESDVVNPMDKVTEQDASWLKNLRFYTGTWLHLLWHCLFDFLESKGMVTTLAYEQMRDDKQLRLSGTIDRIVQFTYCKKPIKVIIDFKSIRYQDYEVEATAATAQPKYVKQMTAYYLLGFPGDTGMLLYENKNSNEIALVTIPRFEPAVEALRDLYGMMNTWVDQMIAYHKTSDPKYGVKERIKLPVITEQCPDCPYKKSCHVEHPEIVDELQHGIVPDGTF